MKNKIPNNWQKVNLRDVLDETPQYGFTARSTKLKVGPKLLRITDIQSNFVDWENVPYCKIPEKEKSKYLLQQGDIVFARTGNTTGANFYLNNMPREEAVFASYLIRIRPDKEQCLPEYLAYFFRSRSYWAQVKNLLSGSAQPGINASNLQNLEFNLPRDIELQSHIVGILSVFDDKIELNNKIAKNLEEMAKGIFKEWFVKFKFSGYEKTKFVESELGKIPKGWEYVRLEKICDIAYGKDLKTNELKPLGNLVYGGNGVIGFSERYLYEESKVIVGCRGAYSGNILKTKPKSWITHNSLVLNIKNPENITNNFLFFALQKANVKSTITGSAQPQITTTELNKLSILMPENKYLKEFELIVGPIEDKILTVELENQKLVAFRDLFLPKLMKGEIKV